MARTVVGGQMTVERCGEPGDRFVLPYKETGWLCPSWQTPVLV